MGYARVPNPLYSMVSFSDIRYSNALEIGQKQNLIMEKVMKTPTPKSIICFC